MSLNNCCKPVFGPWGKKVKCILDKQVTQAAKNLFCTRHYYTNKTFYEMKNSPYMFYHSYKGLNCSPNPCDAQMSA